MIHEIWCFPYGKDESVHGFNAIYHQKSQHVRVSIVSALALGFYDSPSPNFSYKMKHSCYVHIIWPLWGYRKVCALHVTDSICLKNWNTTDLDRMILIDVCLTIRTSLARLIILSPPHESELLRAVLKGDTSGTRLSPPTRPNPLLPLSPPLVCGDLFFRYLFSRVLRARGRSVGRSPRGRTRRTRPFRPSVRRSGELSSCSSLARSLTSPAAEDAPAGQPRRPLRPFRPSLADERRKKESSPLHPPACLRARTVYVYSIISSP